MYNLIILDYSMPVMDGPQFVIQLKAMIEAEEANWPGSKLKMPYICCCTAYRDVNYRKNAFKVGMDRFLIKPIEDSELSELIALLDN